MAAPPLITLFTETIFFVKCIGVYKKKIFESIYKTRIFKEYNFVRVKKRHCPAEGIRPRTGVASSHIISFAK